MKKLVAYFSATGTTANVAEKIAQILNADLFEIKPKEKYTSSDLNWHDKNSRTTKECNNPSFRPEIENKVENFINITQFLLVFLFGGIKSQT